MPDDNTSTPTETGTPAETGGGTTTAQAAADTAPTVTPVLAEVEKWQGLARKHEAGWKQQTRLAEQRAQQLAELQAATDTVRSEAAQNIAAARLETALARAGMGDEQITNFVQFLDRGRLLKDGQPDPEAIAAVAASIPAALRSGPPDPDQGRASDAKPLDMNAAIRRMAGYP